MRKAMTVLISVMLCFLCACGAAPPEEPQPPLPLQGRVTLHTGGETFRAGFTFDGENADFKLTSPEPLAQVELRCGKTGSTMQAGDVTAPLLEQSAFSALYDALLRLYGGGENAEEGWTIDAEGFPARLRLPDGAAAELVCTSADSLP